MKIKMLMPYFGPWPEWFWLFLKTCQTNKRFEWAFLCDADPPKVRPDNVSFARMSLSEFNRMSSDSLGLKAEVFQPFKVCDFRPAFGHIFASELKKVDYWGWGDIDVIYGNLDEFSKRLVKDSVDVLSVRSQFIGGQFALLRNTPFVNSLYRTGKDWMRVATERRNFNFCELGHFKDRPVESFTDICMKAHLYGDLKLSLKDLGHDDRVLRKRALKLLWKDGALYDLLTGSETMLYHFIDKKKEKSFEVPLHHTTGDFRFQVTGTGISFTEREEIPRRVWLSAAREKIRNDLRRLVSYRKLKQRASE